MIDLATLKEWAESEATLDAGYDLVLLGAIKEIETLRTRNEKLEKIEAEFKTLLTKLERAEEVVLAVSALNFGASISLPWCIESFPRLDAALKTYGKRNLDDAVANCESINEQKLEIETLRDKLKTAEIFIEAAVSSGTDLTSLLITAMAEVEALRDKLKTAERVIKIADLACSSCEDFYHSKEDQHSGPNCPIEDRYAAALKEYRGLE